MNNTYKVTIIEQHPFRSKIPTCGYGRYLLLTLGVMLIVYSLIQLFFPSRPKPALSPVVPIEKNVQPENQSKLIIKPVSLPFLNNVEKKSPDPWAITGELALDDPDFWKTIIIKPGDNLSRIFSRLGLSRDQLTEVLELKKAGRLLKKLDPKKEIKILVDDHNQLRKLIYPMATTKNLIIFWEKDVFREKIDEKAHEITTRLNYAEATIKQSLFLAGQKAGIPQALIQQMVEIFGWDIDFARYMQSGDTFRILYEEKYVDGKKVGNGDIVAAEFTNAGELHRAVRFIDKKGLKNYYTPEGKNLRRAFIRTPVEFARISSRFNLSRHHPILHTIRAHKGVDYSAPHGTPIKATGNGRVDFVGNRSGYGKTIVLEHGTSYTTLYAHMSGFSSELRRGSRVRQGQVIGYVGNTGLATGPHLHYEFRINGVHRDPLAIKLPQDHPIAKENRGAFLVTSENLTRQLDIRRRMKVGVSHRVVTHRSPLPSRLDG